MRLARKVRLSALAAMLAASGAIGAEPLFAPSQRMVAVDPYAGYVQASAPLDINGERRIVDFLVRGEDAALRVRSVAGSGSEGRSIENPDETLRILADNRLAPLWPAVIRWAGPALELQRARYVGKYRRAYKSSKPLPATSTIETSVRPRVRALLQYADALESTGDVAGAENLLRSATISINPRDDWQEAEWSAMTMRLASQYFSDGKEAEALALTAKAEHVLGATPYASNAMVNHAIYLSEAGYYAESLQELEKLEARYTAQVTASRRGASKINGSERFFAAIRACALNGLGRKDEADRIVASLMDSAQPSDSSFMLQTNDAVVERALRCMRRPDAVAAMLLDGIKRSPVAPIPFLELQPAFRLNKVSLAPVTAAVRDDPRIRAATSGVMRVLPAEFEPALNHWHAVG